jgi:RNA polymerase sigma-70 factor (ECF subfamily)
MANNTNSPGGPGQSNDNEALVTDEDLMLRYRDGDAGAFDLLYSRHRAGLFRFISHQCRQPERAQEIFQEVWMKVIGARDRYYPDENAQFRTWLFTIARNAVMDFFRGQAKGDAPLFENDEEESVVVQLPAPRTELPEVRAASREQGEAILRALEALPAPQREAFLMYEEGGMSIDEIAKAVGITFEAAKSRLRYAVAKLREGLRDYA